MGRSAGPVGCGKIWIKASNLPEKLLAHMDVDGDQAASGYPQFNIRLVIEKFFRRCLHPYKHVWLAVFVVCPVGEVVWIYHKARVDLEMPTLFREGHRVSVMAKVRKQFAAITESWPIQEHAKVCNVGRQPSAEACDLQTSPLSSGWLYLLHCTFESYGKLFELAMTRKAWRLSRTHLCPMPLRIIDAVATEY